MNPLFLAALFVCAIWVGLSAAVFFIAWRMSKAEVRK